MGLFSLFKRRKYASSLEDEDTRQEALRRSIETRQQQAELRRLQHELKTNDIKAQIEETRALISAMRGGDDEEKTGGIEETLLTALITKALGTSQNQNNSFSNLGTSPPISEQVSLSDEEIRETLKKIPKQYLKLAKTMPDNAVIGVIKQQGNFTDDTIARSLRILRNEKI